MAVEANHDMLEGPGGECLRGTCCAEVQFKQFATSRSGDLPIVCYAGAAKGAHSIWCIGSQTTQGSSSLWSPGGGSIHGGAWTPDA